MPGQLPQPQPTSGGSKVTLGWCKHSTVENRSSARRTNECEECRKTDGHGLLCHFSSKRRPVWLSARPNGSPESSGSEWHHRDQPPNTLFRFFKEDVFEFCLLQVFCTFILHVQLSWTIPRRSVHIRPSSSCCTETGSLCVCVCFCECVFTN